MGRKGAWGARHIPTHHPPLAPSSYDISQPAGRHLPYSFVGGLSHAETTRRGLSGAVLAHLGEFRLEPREIRRLGCLSAWGGVAFPRCAHPSGRRPTNRQTGSERNSKAGSGQARMRCSTHFESKVKPRDMHWALPVPDTRGVRMASRTVNAKRNRTVWGSMLRRV